MKARVKVMLKKDVLDPQGKAIQHAADALGFGLVRDVRQGKFFEIEFEPATEPKEALALLHEIAEKLLSNPVIEDYEVESLQP